MAYIYRAGGLLSISHQKHVRSTRHFWGRSCVLKSLTNTNLSFIQFKQNYSPWTNTGILIHKFEFVCILVLNQVHLLKLFIPQCKFTQYNNSLCIPASANNNCFHIFPCKPWLQFKIRFPFQFDILIPSLINENTNVVNFLPEPPLSFPTSTD